ncbi:MAG: hypothetical protein GY798_20125 [Hyphomicrobiales bacterium]|nr:hypothetical protein [Hyphomicrobiales bacterium]
MDRWKGDATLGDNPDELFMDDIRQFSPVFIVIDIVNSSAKTIQIVGAYLRIKESFADRQPYLIAVDGRGCDDLDLERAYEVINRGWGAAEDVSVTYAFGEPVQTAEDVFAYRGGTIESSAHFSVVEGIVGMDADLSRLKAGHTCADPADINECVADVQNSGMLGRLADRVTETWGTVMVPVQGTVDYTWVDHEGLSQQRRSPISVEAPLLDLSGPECGAAGVVQRDYPTVKLPLDKKDVRIPISYRATLKPRANKRLALGLVTDKSSRHLFDVVLETADGSTIVSPPIDLLYFLPRLPTYN